MTQLFDFAVVTIFCREVLEGSIIIIEFRTLVNRCEQWPQGLEKKDALRAITVAAIVASLVAIAVITAVAIPLGILSSSFDTRVSFIIEGVSKIVAAVCILQLSLKMPKWLGVYYSQKRDMEISGGLTLRSIRFNVAWNIWREVAECGVFLLPFFLTGQGIKAIPLSAIVGTVIGLLCGLGIYYANRKLQSKLWLAVFTSLVLLFLSTGLFSGGCHNIEKATSTSKQVWEIQGDFWSTDRLPMTIVKPFGWSDSRTVLQIVTFWTWLALGVALHYRKYRQSERLRKEQAAHRQGTEETSQQFTDSTHDDVMDDEAGDVEAQAIDKVTLATQESLDSNPTSHEDGESGVEIEATPDII
jgi:high-affinity iron transporter